MPIIGQERCSLVHGFANRCLPYFIDEWVYIRIYGKVRPGEGAYVALPAAFYTYHSYHHIHSVKVDLSSCSFLYILASFPFPS